MSTTISKHKLLHNQVSSRTGHTRGASNRSSISVRLLYDTINDHARLKTIGKGFVLFKINSPPSAFYIIKPTCISWLVFKMSSYFKKLSKTANPKVCLRCPVMTSSVGRIKTCQFVCADSAVKFNIWDVVGVVWSLIIMSSDEITSLGLFTVGFKLLQAYIMSLWHQISVARTQPFR